MTADLENGAGEFIPTTADLFPSVSMSTPSKALFGPAAANLSWMHGHSVASHVLGSAQEKGRHALQLIRTIVIRSTTPNSLMMKQLSLQGVTFSVTSSCAIRT